MLRIDFLLAKPFLKWAGGKTKIIDDIYKFMISKPLGLNWSIGETGRYIEPFAGSSAAYLGLKKKGIINPQRAILADTNEVLIVSQSTVANPKLVESVISQLRDMEENFKKNKKEFYYTRRQYLNEQIIPNPEKNAIDTAANMIFINKTCFNGLWRINSKGGFNTPLGRPSSGEVTILDEENLRLFSSSVKGVDFLCQDWRVTISNSNYGDLMYVDPPYLPLSDDEYVFSDYSGVGFSNKEHQELAIACAEAAARGVRVIISNNYSIKIEKMYRKAANESGARIAKTRKIRLKRTMKTVSEEKRESVDEILIFMAAKK